MSWMRSGTELSQFLRVFLPTLTYLGNPVFSMDEPSIQV